MYSDCKVLTGQSEKGNCIDYSGRKGTLPRAHNKSKISLLHCQENMWERRSSGVGCGKGVVRRKTDMRKWRSDF